MSIKQIALLVVVALVAAFITYLLIARGFFSLSDTTVAKSSSTPTITYIIKGDKLEIDEITNGTDPYFKKCKNNTKKNCIKIKKGFSGLIEYTFKNQDEDWFLDQFTICRGLDKITNKCDKDLTRNERLEFFVMNNKQGDKILLTPASGQVDLTQLADDDNPRTFYLFDQNTIRRDYFYNIQVCKYESEKKTCLTLDPPVENRGRR